MSGLALTCSFYSRYMFDLKKIYRVIEELSKVLYLRYLKVRYTYANVICRVVCASILAKLSQYHVNVI